MLRDVLIQKGFSTRESEVAELATKGFSDREIANQLFVTEKTVKMHLTNIYKKVNVIGRASLIVYCLPYIGFTGPEGHVGPNVNQHVMDATGTSLTGETPPGTEVVICDLKINRQKDNGLLYCNLRVHATSEMIISADINYIMAAIKQRKFVLVDAQDVLHKISKYYFYGSPV